MSLAGASPETVRGEAREVAAVGSRIGDISGPRVAVRVEAWGAPFGARLGVCVSVTPRSAR